MLQKKKKIYVITGISNVIGKEFMRYYSYDNENYVLGISRSVLPDYGFNNSSQVQCDLLNLKNVSDILHAEFQKIDWSSVEELILIHTAGKAKNELPGMNIIDNNGDGIDDEMFDAQITTFDNIHNFIVSYLYHKQIFYSLKITIVGLGSLLDTYLSPIHYSMRNINNMSRDSLRHLIDVYENYHTITLSVSTVASDTEIVYRKHADQTYRLRGDEVVDKSVDIINKRKHEYQDVQIFKHHPLYKKYFTYETIEQRINRFKKEIGL